MRLANWVSGVLTRYPVLVTDIVPKHSSIGQPCKYM